MFDYIKGTITNIKHNSIVVDNNGIGYLIYVSNPYSFEVGKDYKVYVYQQIKEDDNSLFGFKTPFELFKVTEEKTGAKTKKEARSMIHPDYANRFIRQYLIEIDD